MKEVAYNHMLTKYIPTWLGRLLRVSSQVQSIAPLFQFCNRIWRGGGGEMQIPVPYGDNENPKCVKQI